MSVFVHAIYKEEFGKIYSRRYEFVTAVPSCDNVKGTMCHAPKADSWCCLESCRLYFNHHSWGYVKTVGQFSILKADRMIELARRLFVFGGEEYRKAQNQGKTFFLDGTLKVVHSCLPSIQTLVVTMLNELFALLPDKIFETYVNLFKIVKEWSAVDYTIDKTRLWSSCPLGFPTCHNFRLQFPSRNVYCE